MRQTSGRPIGLRGRVDLFASASTVVATLLVAPIAASASPVTFDLDGIFLSGSSLGGTLTIDTATGVATAADVAIGPPASLTFGVIEGQRQNGPATLITIGDGGALADLDIALPRASLIGYAGGGLCTSPSACGGLTSGIRYSSPPGGDPLATGNASMPQHPNPLRSRCLLRPWLGSGWGDDETRAATALPSSAG